MSAAPDWKQFICRACGLIYDEEQGDPDSGLAPGTRFADIPEDWCCPLCGVVKSDFEPWQPLAAATPAAAADAPLVPRQAAGVVIVGGGCAGWAAAEALRALDPDLPLTLVSGCNADRYHKPELSLALSRGLDGAALERESAAQAARRLGVRLLADTFVAGLSPAQHQLRTTRGTLPYTRLVLAMGAAPALPAALPAALCWRVNDLAGWEGLRRAMAGAPKRVTIVGAGMIGCELAEDFSHAGHAVTLLDTHAGPLAALLPEPASQRLRAGLERLGVRFIGAARVEAVSRQDGVTRVALGDGSVLAADVVVAATGLVTDGRIARGAGLVFERGIAVDPHTLQSSAADVYALGDCISILGAPCRFIEPIARQASALAHAVTGRAHDGYAHSQPVIRLKTRSTPVVVRGLPAAAGEWRVVEEDDGYLQLRQWRGGVPGASIEVGARPPT